MLINAPPTNQGSDPPPVALSNDRMRTIWFPIDKLYQPPGAPRRFSKKELEKAKDIMRRWGVRVPLAVRSDGRVISHFLIVAAARALGHDELPVVICDDLSESEVDQLSIALGRLYELGKFDQELLGDVLLKIEINTPEIDFGTLGLEIGERDRAVLATSRRGKDEASLKLEPVAVSAPGSIWLCDQHRVGCGDAGNHNWLDSLMLGWLAAMVFTDYPYGCRVAGFVTSRDHREFAQGAGRESEDELHALFVQWSECILEKSRPGTLVYLCIDWRSLGLLLDAATGVFGELLNLIVWGKDRAGMGSLYRSQHELILLFRAPGGKHLNNVQLGRFGRDRSNLWTYPSAMTFGVTGTEGDLLEDHPTPKNKEMIADAILDCTQPGDVVFDPFLGSGSTLIAADKVGRQFVGSDLDPLYVDLAIRRWQAWTGKQAFDVESGRPFDEIERERIARSRIAVGETIDG